MWQKICTTYRVIPSPDIDELVRILVRQAKGTAADRSSRPFPRLKMDGGKNIPANTLRTYPGIFAVSPTRNCPLDWWQADAQARLLCMVAYVQPLSNGSYGLCAALEYFPSKKRGALGKALRLLIQWI